MRLPFLNSKQSYIEYDNKNSMYNEGHIHVYVDGKEVEYIFVDEYLEEYKALTDEPCMVDDIIDMLKEKYRITKVIRHEINWR